MTQLNQQRLPQMPGGSLARDPFDLTLPLFGPVCKHLGDLQQINPNFNNPLSLGLVAFRFFIRNTPIECGDPDRLNRFLKGFFGSSFSEIR